MAAQRFSVAAETLAVHGVQETLIACEQFPQLLTAEQVSVLLVRSTHSAGHRKAADHRYFTARISLVAVIVWPNADIDVSSRSTIGSSGRSPDTLPRFRRGPGIQDFAAAPRVLRKVECDEQRLGQRPMLAISVAVVQSRIFPLRTNDLH